jgi:transglutaminase-like putative cysteine protease
MTINRRETITGSAAIAVAASLPKSALAQISVPTFAPKPEGWRTYEIVTRLEILKPRGTTQAWIPLPSFSASDWIRPGQSTWKTNAPTAAEKRDPQYGPGLLHVVWAAGEAAPVVEVVSRFAGRDRAIDLTRPGKPAPLGAAERNHYTAPTELLPTGGIVKETADKIVAGAATDMDKAKRIYEWIVDNTFRNPKTRGCGVGDIASMLKTNNLSGKCADLNALYVGLARAAGLPARELYGIRVAASQFGYKSLGANTETITRAQHCRAEVHLEGFGWVPVDPADVRKVVLEEPPGNLALTDDRVTAARAALFGAWETNWLAYNDAHDVVLPGSAGPKLGFLMYPQAEIGTERLDSLDPDNFKYTITAKAIAS